MAQIKGILVNDGGAPARIMNFVAAADISAGECLRIDAAGKVALTTDDNVPLAGVALTDVDSGAQCSMVTGGGVILYVVCKADVNTGDVLMTDDDSAGVAGSLKVGGATDTNFPVAQALEDAPAAGGLTKVLVF
jgi:hypothetical protein